MSNDPNTNEAKLERMRRDLNGGFDPLEEKRKKYERMELPFHLDDEEPEQVRPMAYMHRTNDSCVTAAVGDSPELIYENPRVLVHWNDVVDALDWYEKGIGEWRAYAIEGRAQLKELRADLAAIKEQRNELLAALKAFADWHDERSGDNECRPLENARAAIAQAEGKA